MKRDCIGLCWFIGLILLLQGHAAMAVPAFPAQTEMAQPDGKKIRILMKGDEFFSWTETADGYATIKDPKDGYWKYAKPKSKSVGFDLLSDARVGKRNPKTLGLKPYALPDRKAMSKRAGKLCDQLRGIRKTEGTLSSRTGQKGTETDSGGELLSTKIAVSGKTRIRNIVILAAFRDHWDSTAGTVLATQGRVDTGEYDQLFNQVGYATDGAAGSVRDYYQEVSYGKLTVESVITPWVQLPNAEAYYGADGTSTDPNWAQMVSDAISAASAAGFDFSQGDSDSDGWVDCLTVIHSGHGQEYTGNPTTALWSKQGELSSVVTANGVKMKRCHLEPALRGLVAETGIVRIGVICHEMGHFFGLPDLYDYSAQTYGVGNWDIMANGCWNGNYGNKPGHFSVWSKSMLGFLQPEEVHSADFLLLPQIEKNATAHLIHDGFSNGEYFLVENRGNVGFDNTSAIYPGIVIYHVYTPSANNDLGTWAHPLLKIEEADGDNSLGSKSAYSESGDVWKSTNGLAAGLCDQTGNKNTNTLRYQSTHYYRRSNTSSDYSYNRLYGFSASGPYMNYALTSLRPTMESQTVDGSLYDLFWTASSEATCYEVQEGTPVTLNRFFDGAEDENTAYANWHMAGMSVRDNNGAKTGAYSYAMHRYYNGKWYPSVQTLTMKNAVTVTRDVVLSFALMSHASGAGLLKCQVSNDGGTSWGTLATYDGYIDPWTEQTFTFTDFQKVGINENDSCLLRFTANFEQTQGWSGFPGYGYAFDDITLVGIRYPGYTGWATLSDTVTDTTYAVEGRSNGDRAYRVRAYANDAWQDYGPVGVVSIMNASVAVSATITSTVSSPTAESPIPVVVTFSADVNGFDASDVVAGNGTVTDFSGSGNCYQFNLAPAAVGLVTVDVPGGVCTDEAGNANVAAATLSLDYEVEGPSVVSMVRTMPDPTNAESIGWIVTFSEPVVGVDGSDFELVTTNVSGAQLTSVTGSGTTWTVMASSGCGDGTIGLNLRDNDSICNGDDVPLGGPGKNNGVATGPVYQIDKTSPAIKLTAATAAGSTALSPIHVCAQWNETVYGFGVSDISATNATISNFTGSSPYYEFDLVPGGEGTVNVLVASSKAMDLAGNKNIASNKLAWTYDTKPPVLVSVVRKHPELTCRTRVSWEVTFNEAVNGVDSTDFEVLGADGVSGAAISEISGNRTKWTVTATTGTGNGTLTLTMLNDGTIQDYAGNVLASETVYDGPAYQIDKTPPVPALSADPAPGYIGMETVHVAVVWSKTPVYGFDASGIVTTNATVSGFTGSSPYYEFEVTPLDQGPVTVQVASSHVTDLAGNKNKASVRMTWICDTVPPVVTEITRKQADPTNRTSVSWIVTFSEKVVNVDPADFALTATGELNGAVITSVLGSRTTWTVTASTGNGSGTLGLALADDDSITDIRGNLLGGVGMGNGDFTGPVYTVDKSKPVITSFTINNGVLTTTTEKVTLNNICTGDPIWYMASESSLFDDASWQPYAAAPEFALSGEGGRKTVYLKVKNAAGTVSSIKTDTITLCDTLTLILPGEVTLPLIRIPAGKFTMGSPITEQERQLNEGPQHRITLSNDFYMGIAPVTKRQWTAVMGTVPWLNQENGGPDSPAVCITWDDAQAFIAAVNGLGQGTYALPTEAQWEYATRAGTTTRFFWGEDPALSLIDVYAWYTANASVTQPVAQKLPNPFALYDVSGNVWEWCQDWYGSYTSRSAVDPAGPVTGANRVVRGGSIATAGEACRSASREGTAPTDQLCDVGFRIVK